MTTVPPFSTSTWVLMVVVDMAMPAAVVSPGCRGHIDSKNDVAFGRDLQRDFELQVGLAKASDINAAGCRGLVGNSVPARSAPSDRSPRE
jgi:hypothetical protein